MYKKRYKDQAKQNAYMNACDCLKYGYSRDFWNSCGIDKNDEQGIWDKAVKDMTRF